MCATCDWIEELCRREAVFKPRLAARLAAECPWKDEDSNG